MLHRSKLSTLLQGLTLLLLGPACEASSLGMTIHVVPLDSDGGKTVRAHFSAIAPSPCPALSGLCAAGEDCLVHATSLPFNGTKPGSGWCVRQWQKTVPSNYDASISLGSNTVFYVSMRAGPNVRANSGRLNQPAYVALPPPLRARVNCLHHFHLSVKDPDGDRVRCRFARPDQGECLGCARHAFIELDEEKCMLTFTGKAPAGQYFIYLMAEDLIPAPKRSHVIYNKPLSSIPVHLSLTVEESTSRCSDEPVATGDTPAQDTTLLVLPYQQVKFNVNFLSQLESVSEIAVVAPPELYRTSFKSVGPLSMMTMAWVRSQNRLARLLPVCFAANTKSLQSEPRCVWLCQRETRTLPAGTELRCEATQMRLSLPVASLRGVDLGELRLNSPTCPMGYNGTHLTASIPLGGCGTTAVHAGSELVYTNTLQSVRPYTMISRKPALILPLACRIPGAQVKGPEYEINMPTEMETFGRIRIWIEIHRPGQGPMKKFTRTPKLHSLYIPSGRVRREAAPPSVKASRVDQLDLHVMSNCSVDRAELIVSNCLESETEDFAETSPILEQGCTASNSTLEVLTTQTNTKIYRLDLNQLESKGTTMYVQCTVNLCIATMPSQKCPDLCTRSIGHRSLVDSIFTKTYTVRSGRVSLVVTTPSPTRAPVSNNTDVAPATPTDAAAATTAAAVAPNKPSSHAPQQASSMAAGVILTTISICVQNFFLH